MKKNVSVQYLLQKLDEELNHFEMGEKFYSYREIARKYDVNQRIIDEVLSQMERKRLLVRKPRSGIFCNTNRRKDVRNILFACQDYPSKFIDDILLALNEFELANPIYSIVRQNLEFRQAISNQIASPEKYEALILMKSSRTISNGDLKQLASIAERRPVVLLDTDLEDISICTATANNMQGGMLAADYLYRHGHRNVAVAISEPHNGNTQQRVEAFCTYMRLHECNVQLIDNNTQHGWFPAQGAYDMMLRHLTERGCDFTALFVISDGSALGVLKALRQVGISVPEQVSVIGFDGLKDAKFFEPALTSVGYDYREMIEQIFHELDRYHAGCGAPFHLRVPLHIIERQSVASPTTHPWKGPSSLL